MNIGIKRHAVIMCLVLGFLASSVSAATVDLPDGSKLDLSQTCPVCDMKLESGELGVAAIVFEDGKVVGFDAAGDLFRYYFTHEKYHADSAKIKNAYVTDYGTKKLIDAKQATYVLGAKLKAVMGPEAFPFADKAAAEKFKSDHNGKKIASFSEVSLEDLTVKKKTLKMDRGHNH